MSSPEPFHIRGVRFAVAVIRLYRKILATTDTPRSVLTQMLRAGTAVGANLEEARSAYSRRDLAAKYGIALREARECHYWFRLLTIDQPPLLPHIAPLLDECNQLISVLTVTIRRRRA